MNKKFILTVLVVLLCSVIFAEYKTMEKLRVAVMPFTLARNIDRSYENIARTELTNMLQTMGVFIVINESEMEEVMLRIRDRAFTENRAIDELLKEVAQADVIGRGEFVSLSVERYTQEYQKGYFYKAEARINLAFTDVQGALGTVVLSNSQTGSSSGQRNPEDAVRQAVISAIDEQYERLMNIYPVRGCVIEILEQGRRTFAILDVGENFNIGVGRRFKVYEDGGEPLRHPHTGEIIEEASGKFICEVEVRQVKENTCAVLIPRRVARNNEVKVGMIVKSEPIGYFTRAFQSIHKEINDF
jgi:hypothetical protein